MSSPTSLTRPAAVDPRIRRLISGSVENLLATWSDSLGLFPYASRLEGTAIVNDYAHPMAVRYTISSLLGLMEAARSEAADVSEPEVRALATTFLTRGHESGQLPADRGLSTVLLCALGADTAALGSHVRGLADVLARGNANTLNMQDAAWILWGAAAAYRAGIAPAADVMRSAYRLITRDLVDEGTGLPRHSARRYRRNVLSFGALTYFLRALHETAVTLGDEDAHRRFDAGVAHAIALQGPRGEWPWMIDARRGTAFDIYPVFAVHQDSMAMLFLHPALDRGLPGAREAISRSLAWVFGNNELGLPMFVERPFFAYRAIERSEGAPRVRRYARSLQRQIWPGTAAWGARGTRLNAECRSYHLGWLLYVWCDRPEVRAARARRLTVAAAEAPG